MHDTIEIRGLRALRYCGALAEEQARAQPFEVDLDLVVDLRQAGASDDLADTVDYASVIDGVASVLAREHVTLLERLAERIAQVALADERVTEVTVAVRKLRPPVAQQLDTTGVRITRSR